MCQPRTYKMTVDRLNEENYMDYWGTDWMCNFLDEIILFYTQQYWEALRRGYDPGMTVHEWTIRCLTANHTFGQFPATAIPLGTQDFDMDAYPNDEGADNDVADDEDADDMDEDVDVVNVDDEDDGDEDVDVVNVDDEDDGDENR